MRTKLEEWNQPTSRLTKSYSKQGSVLLANKQTDQQNTIRKARNTFINMAIWASAKEEHQQWGKIAFSTNDAGITRYPHASKNTFYHIPPTIHKSDFCDLFVPFLRFTSKLALQFPVERKSEPQSNRHTTQCRVCIKVGLATKTNKEKRSQGDGKLWGVWWCLETKIKSSADHHSS